MPPVKQTLNTRFIGSIKSRISEFYPSFAMKTMRPFLLPFFAGMAGCLCMFLLLGEISSRHTQSSPSPALQTVSYTPDGLPSAGIRDVLPDNSQALVPEGKLRTAPPGDFTSAARGGMRCVVHIAAEESDAMARQRIRQQQWMNPFSWLEDDFFQRLAGTGSGVIFSQDGYIVTNNHVIDFADKFTVTLYDNRKFAATLIGRDPKTDLAVLKIQATGLQVIPFGDSDDVEVGQWALAVGNPFNLKSTVTAGIISAVGRDIDIIKAKDAVEAFIQTDAAVNPGNSGGALIDAEGKLIGINTAIASNTGSYTGYSFAIPVNMVQRIVQDIIRKGFSENPSLGISAYDVDPDLVKELQLSVDAGVVVEYIEKGSSAEVAGLKRNDVIIGVNGKSIASVKALVQMIESLRVGDKVVLIVNRGGRNVQIPLVLSSGK
jgi:S1-C subfamily serine protease